MMVRRFYGLCILLMLVLATGIQALYADVPPEIPEQKEEKKTDALYKTRIGGMLWINWHMGLEKKKATNMFEIERAFLILAKRFNDIFSVNVVWDVTPETDSTGRYKKYIPYIRTANADAQVKIDIFKLWFKLGMIETPFVFESTRTGKFHINQDPVFRNDIDPFYDLGFGMQLNVDKYIEFYWTITEGEGYRKIGTKNDRGKAYSGRISFFPYEGISIDGYGQANLTNGNDMKKTMTSYGGAGMSYSNSYMKLGAKFIHQQVKTSELDADESKNHDWLIDAWFNMNLESLTNYPFLLWLNFEYYYDMHGNNINYRNADRYALTTAFPYYVQKLGVINPYLKQNSDKHFEAGLGFGYQFLKNIEANLYYSIGKTSYSCKIQHTVYTKLAIRF